MILITAEHEGINKTLSVPQWSRLINIPRERIYTRVKNCKNKREAIEGLLRPQIKVDKELINNYYQAFNYSYGILNPWRQQNAIR